MIRITLCQRMAGMGPSRAAAIAVLSLRVAYGAALVVAPGRLTRSWLGPAGGEPPAAVAVRGLGAREVALHGAAIVAARARPAAAAVAGSEHRRRRVRHRGDGGGAPRHPREGAARDRGGRRGVGGDQRGGGGGGGPLSEPLVLLHTLGTDHRMWDPVVERLDGARRVLTPDLPGHGDEPPPADASPPALAAAIADRLAA